MKSTAILIKNEFENVVKNPSLLVLMLLPVFISKMVLTSMPDQAANLLPSWILFAQVMVGIMLTGPNLLEERTNKTIDALLITPLSYKKVLAGKGIMVLGLSLLSQLLVMAINGFLDTFSISMFFVLILGGLCFICVGYLVGMLLNSPRNGTAVSSILMVSLFLLGTVYPSYPEWKHLLRFIPSVEVVENMHSILKGNGFSGLDLFLLLAWIVVIFTFILLKARK